MHTSAHSPCSTCISELGNPRELVTLLDTGKEKALETLFSPGAKGQRAGSPQPSRAGPEFAGEVRALAKPCSKATLAL